MRKQEGPQGPGSLTWLIGQKVTVEPLFTPETQIEKPEIALSEQYLYTVTKEIFV